MSVAVNGVEVLAADDEPPEMAAVRELLRQRAVSVGLLPEGAADEMVIAAGIEQLLDREVRTPEPTEEECRRHYDAHPLDFRSDDLVHARHILFQVTPAVNVPQIRERAEATLNLLLAEPGRFGEMARELSNCPSGAQDGNLGQIARGDVVPEFERVLFHPGNKGLLRDVVRTRFGFHIVAIDEVLLGERLPFELVRERIAALLRESVEEHALRQYVSLLAGQAEIAGVALEAAASPLVQ
ncbi:MAG TPA: peptidylprolyl isomerase [Devosiaceae bacterium]|nr:peptidylprolyl isomerase [Devosiaceae bacterium]